MRLTFEKNPHGTKPQGRNLKDRNPDYFTLNGIKSRKKKIQASRPKSKDPRPILKPRLEFGVWSL